MPELSPKQRKITELRDCNILVSAAAGSGKTSVLVERIIKRITDDTDPIDIDRILVLTFTRAAAGEMRSRIADAIAKLIEDNPHDERLKRQAGLIYNAQINTIDSFCLNILSNNFTEIGLEPGFRVADEKEIKILEDQVLDETLEEVLGQREADDGDKIDGLTEFLDRFESKDNMRKIRNSISDVYKEADKAPFIEDYIEARRRDYEVSGSDELIKTPWFMEFYGDARQMLESAADKYRMLRELCSTSGPAEYLPMCDSDGEILDRLLNAKGYEELRKAAESGISWFRRPGKASCDPQTKEEACKLRDLYKDLINKVVSDYLSIPLDIQTECMQKTGKAVNALLDIVWLYHQRLSNIKREKGLLTFSDVEHMALRILLRKEGDTYVPTQVALDYRNVYRELMIDEYQDSNRTQEWLIHAISGEDEGIYDRFIVGDVKQSIYRFRNADPTLFMEKYTEYTPDTGDHVRIDLSMNYRSRQQVLSTVNAVFERIMDREIGGVDYDEANRLHYGGLFDDPQGEDPERESHYRSEIILTEYEKDSGLGKTAQEAHVLAMRIKKLIEEQVIFDLKTKEYRECRYRDIVVLMRSTPGDIDDMRHILEENGIPVHMPSKGGYFDTTEIVAVLNFLKILNNPYEEIALYGTLKSVFGGFDENEAAVIRLSGEGLYDGLKNLSRIYAELAEDTGKARIPEALNGFDTEEIRQLGLRVTHFLEQYNELRNIMPYTPVYKLIRMIFDRYDYVEYVSALPAGDRRKANVLALLGKAESYDSNGFGGIFDFCRYIEKMRKYDSDEGEAMTLGENENVVRIMTMHKSKGLEFPVCILAGLGRKLNFQDSKAEIVFHDRYGLALDHIDSGRRVKYRDMRKRFLVSRINRETISEELRIFYVAMTRAKEKLIMSAVIDPKEAEGPNICENSLDITERMKIDSFYKILKMTRGNDDWGGQCDVISHNAEDIEKTEANSLGNEGIRRETFPEKMTEVSPQDVDAANELKNKIMFKYTHKELENLYTKTSVSELKMAAIHEGLLKGDRYDIPDDFFKLHEEEAYIPSFAGEEKDKAPSGADVGSAFHRVMELVDFTDAEGLTEAGLDGQMEKHLKSGALLKEDYELVNKAKIVDFAGSDIGKRMKKAAAEGRLYKEKPFVLGISADRLDPTFPADETVMIQGIIDVFFIEDDHVVLLDYKTDSVREAGELTSRYKTQMDYYEEALRRILGKNVSERILYSFALEKAVNC